MRTRALAHYLGYYNTALPHVASTVRRLGKSSRRCEQPLDQQQLAICRRPGGNLIDVLDTVRAQHIVERDYGKQDTNLRSAR